MKDKIDSTILKMDSTALPGTRTFMIHYQSVCSQVLKDLTAEEKERCEQLVQEWNKDGPDAAMKAQ